MPIRLSAVSAAAALILGTIVAVIGPAASAATAPPAVPTGLAPAGDTVTEIPVLSWDRVAGATTYDVQVSTTDDFSAIAWSVTNTVNAQAVPTKQLPFTTFSWRIRANEGSMHSAWSDAATFTRSATLPPGDLKTTQTSYTAPDAPTFDWSPVDGATSYTLTISTDPQFTDPTLVKTFTTKKSSYAVTALPAPEPEHAPYYWRVQATLASGITTAWSDTASYAVNPLPTPQRVSPTEGEVIDGDVADVALDWAPVPGAASYNLQVSTDWQFKSTVDNVTGLVSTRYAPATTYNNDTYYWRVTAVDAAGNAAPWPQPTVVSDAWSFTRVWSTQPDLVWPEDGATVSSEPLFFEWKGARLASSYKIQVSPTSDFDDPRAETCATDLTTFTPTPTACTPTKGTVYWRVIGIDAPKGVVSQAIHAQVRSFTYEPPEDDATYVPQMVAGYDVALDGTGFDGAATTHCDTEQCVDLRQTPVLRWNAVPGAASYKVYLSRDMQFTNLLTGFPKTVEQPMWAPTAALPDSQAGQTAYYWEVAPCKTTTSGCLGLADAEYAFNKLSGVMQTHDPACASTTCADDVTVTWDDYLASETADPNPEGTTSRTTLTTPARTEAKSYVVEWATDVNFTQNRKSATVDQTSFTLSTDTYPEGPVYWRVHAVDDANNPLAPSIVRTFTKRSPVPEAEPPTTAIDSHAVARLRWKPLNFAKSYDVQVFPAANGVPSSSTPVVNVTTQQATYDASDVLVPGVSYVWHVRRTDAAGRKGAWSNEVDGASWTALTVRTVDVPLVSPAGGDSTVTPDGALFRWEPVDGAATYRFELRASGSTTATTVTTPALATAPTKAITGGVWTWDVVALDTNGKALGTSQTRTFTVFDTPTVVSPARITGTFRVDATLVAVDPEWSLSGFTNSYQWLRDGVTISGATATTFRVRPTDAGHRITLKVTASRAGYRSATSVSQPVTPRTAPPLVATVAPRITGTRKVGQLLTAMKGTWAKPGVGVAYQWLRAGRAISGATSSTHRVVAADAGAALSVRVTASLTGYANGTSASAAVTVARLVSVTKATLSAKRIKASQRTTLTISVTASGLPSPTGKIQVKRGAKVLARKTLWTAAHGRTKIRLPKLKPGTYRLVVTYAGTAAVAPSRRAVTLRVVR